MLNVGIQLIFKTLYIIVNNIMKQSLGYLYETAPSSEATTIKYVHSAVNQILGILKYGK